MTNWYHTSPNRLVGNRWFALERTWALTQAFSRQIGALRKSPYITHRKAHTGRI